MIVRHVMPPSGPPSEADDVALVRVEEAHRGRRRRWRRQDVEVGDDVADELGSSAREVVGMAMRLRSSPACCSAVHDHRHPVRHPGVQARRLTKLCALRASAVAATHRSRSPRTELLVALEAKGHLARLREVRRGRRWRSGHARRPACWGAGGVTHQGPAIPSAMSAACEGGARTLLSSVIPSGGGHGTGGARRDSPTTSSPGVPGRDCSPATPRVERRRITAADGPTACRAAPARRARWTQADERTTRPARVPVCVPWSMKTSPLTIV